MNNIRRGFTMIELIFVIVIIGILAGVAVPKLSATRDDAVVSKSVQEVQQAISEIGAYYTAHGKFGIWKDMTNVYVDKSTNDFSIRGASLTYKVGKVDGCVVFRNNTDGNMTVLTPTTTTTDKVCDKVKERLDKAGLADRKNGTTYLFGGSAIDY